MAAIRARISMDDVLSLDETDGPVVCFLGPIPMDRCAVLYCLYLRDHWAWRVCSGYKLVASETAGWPIKLTG